ncbi:hypothetical protein A3K29_05125 [Candidatus Collierbacteria bacterium RIFOXYB2_FULL_46_14]|uniref:LytR/CpsA/Psr regulator C-terminal domain-containing protein n=1 Tax=Candidatus Collierbacteria bacterium GW2011_GWA2_46_26 TaxID=1618381 RepID=A0A0G1PJP1_9BACT|nr:MAG: hypothetical protein UX47_C0006G0010 [Candidatus Collierbacteria bacterium GW2011_GWA2_46_26]OGD73476.1 MAG: hypothetical protein A3K29_05125 [Candidatus Collierbacteria bacterium RIFOXYB2_FULL_46_14]OGD76518.1 MAG: hypothetical protein A3K43_05125 [Candidatus Collierbacteria bacterium RIFOXYA2_FULL_46_20]OGD77854.1 MAG: hypothetical protein A3K39_05125 [Candidatus Collierbacteria bacterium RIFOXYC2_FULL_43_15]OGD81145.1 MAG: hypothetical protein A2320_05625 [Pseudomonadales bacterium G
MIKLSKAQLLAIGVVVVIGGLTLNSFRLSKQNKRLGIEIETLKKDPNSVAREEIKMLTEKLAKLVVLPADEEPVVATVTDKEKLKDQPVFARAENGDKILIYSKAQKAYIYRPSTNLLVDVVPVNIGNQQISISGVDERNPLKIALVNGSKNSGITNELEKRIVEKNIPGVSIVSKATAKSDAYEKTLVVDLTGKLGKQAAEMAQLVGGEVATQSAETYPKADLMIMVGADFK